MEKKRSLVLLHYRREPETVLAALDMVIAYLMPRAAVRQGEKRKSQGGKLSSAGDTWKRAIPRYAFEQARQLLNVQARRFAFDGILHWGLSPKWVDRLRLAGIDPDTLQVVDQGRWNMAYEQLRTTYRFYAGVQRERIAKGYIAPLAVPTVTKTFVIPPRKDTARSRAREISEADEEQMVGGIYGFKRVNRRKIIT